MFRPASRLIARSSALRAVPRATAPTTRRFLSTAPPTQKSRSWKSLVARLGIAGTIIYYYNTTDVFAEEPQHTVHTLPETDHETEQLPTIDALAQERQQRKAQAVAAEKASNAGAQQGDIASGVEGLEEEADQQGAFNPETGEINWDCPCLGGMAHGPCGEEFKAAFSCFVFSTDEPKGMDCIDKFKDMQNCFRQYPEVYGAELEADEEDDVTADHDQLFAAESNEVPDKQKVGAAAPKEHPSPSSEREGQAERAQAATEQVREGHGDSHKQYAGAAKTDESSSKEQSSTERAKAATEQVRRDHGQSLSESEHILPKASHDGRGANETALKEAWEEKK